MNASRRVRLLLAAWVVVPLCAPPARACSVPVFRYALERWPASPYEVVVMHRGPLSGDANRAVDALLAAPDVDPTYANVLTVVHDLDDPNCPPGVRALHEQLGSPDRPWATMMYPSLYPGYYAPVGIDPNRLLDPNSRFHAGPVTFPVVGLVLDSPVRREAARKLLSGDSGVFLLLEGSDGNANRSAHELIDRLIEELPAKVEPSEVTEQDREMYMAPGGPELKVAFSKLTLRRDDPAERMTVKMILGLAPWLVEETGPAVIPLYGRGRMLQAFAGETLNEEYLTGAAWFLVGPCSCQAKAQSPGIDLLMSAGWDNFLVADANVQEDLPPLTGLPVLAAVDPSAALEPLDVDGNAPKLSGVASGGSTSPLPTAGSNTLYRNLAVVILLVLAAAAIASVALRRSQDAA
jgi:hypothetical protein